MRLKKELKINGTQRKTQSKKASFFGSRKKMVEMPLSENEIVQQTKYTEQKLLKNIR